MLSFLARGHPPQRTNTASQKQVFYEDGRSCQEFYTPEESTSFVCHSFYPDTKLFHPLLHFHPIQTEIFHIRKGVCHFFVSENATIPDASKPVVKEGPGDAIVPINAYHRFENGGKDGEQLVVDYELSPDTRTIEFAFFRNFFGYLEDCRKHDLEPSMFQIMLFIWHMTALPAISVPFLPASACMAVSKAFCFVTGVVIGQWVLGYKKSYPEYYREQTD